MTTGGSSTGDDAGESDFIRPSMTIRKRHDKLLDELNEARYGSRSEAARAAIELLAKSVLENGETGIEQLSEQILQLQARIDELDSKIEGIQGHHLAGNGVNPGIQTRNADDSNHNLPTVESTESKGSDELHHDVYETLTVEGPMPVADIAEHLDRESIEVHEALTVLVQEHEFVACTNQEDTPQYRIKPVNTN